MRFNVAAAVVAACAAVLPSPEGFALAAQPAARPMLAGAWTLNPSLGTPAGAVALGGNDEEPPRRRDGGGGGRRPIGPGNIPDSPFPTSGHRSSGEPPPPANRGPLNEALLQELLHPVARLTITQDGDRIVFVEADGASREYVANDKVERHQLVNGTIETKARWDKDTLVLELRASKRTTVVKRYARRGGRLEVTTAIDGGPKHAKRVAVYESGDGAPPADR